MSDNEKYFTPGDGIKMEPPYVFILQEGLWVPHDLRLKMLFHEGRQSYLVYNDDLVMYDEPVKNNQINPVFINKDMGLIAAADSSFSLLLPYQYLRYDRSRSESLIGYLVREDSAGNPILYYPDKSRVFGEDSEWIFEFGKIYWKTDSSTALLSNDRLNDIIIPEKIDSVNLREKLFIKYLNEPCDSFKVYDSDLNVSGNMKGQLIDFFWDYFFLTIDGRDSLGICRMYDWKGNLIRADNVSEFRSFRTHEAGETIIRFYGDTLVDVLDLPENFRNMNYSFGYEVSTHNDTKLYGWNEFFSFAYDLKSKTFTREFRIVDHPDPNKYQKFIKLPDPPPTTYRDFSVTKKNDRYLINCKSPGITCIYEADEYEVGEFDSISILIVTDFESSSTIAINSYGKILYHEKCQDDITVWAFYGDNLLTIEDDRTDTTFISAVHSSGDTIMWDAILEMPEVDHDFIYFRKKGSEYISLYVIGSNVKIIDYNKCPLLADSLQSKFAYLFGGFGLLNVYYTNIRDFPILKYPLLPLQKEWPEDPILYSKTDFGIIYINPYALNPYYADPEIIQQVSYKGRVIDCSGK